MIRFIRMITILAILIAASSMVSAVVSHSAAEITPGIFQSGEFSFPGNVGIGTSDPEAKLHIAGAVKVTGTDIPHIRMMQDDVSDAYFSIHYQDDSLRFGVYNKTDNVWISNMAYFSDDAPDGTITVDDSGYLGISTKNPSERLEVNGHIKLSGASPTFRILNVATPTADSDAATKAYVDASSGGGVTFEGYTSSTLNGASGDDGFKGKNYYCDLVYSGSHTCTYDELLMLGSDYPYTYQIWIIDGSYSTGSYLIARDGGAFTSTNAQYPNCAGWTTGSSSFYGGSMETDGTMTLESCSHYYRMACCS